MSCLPDKCLCNKTSLTALLDPGKIDSENFAYTLTCALTDFNNTIMEVKPLPQSVDETNLHTTIVELLKPTLNAHNWDISVEVAGPYSWAVTTWPLQAVTEEGCLCQLSWDVNLICIKRVKKNT